MKRSSDNASMGLRGAIVYLLFGGHVWLACTALLTILALVDFLLLPSPRSGPGRIAGFLTILLIPLAALTGTSPPPGLALLFLVGALLCAWGRSRLQLGRNRRLIALLAAGLALGAFVYEWRFFYVAPKGGRKPSRIVVLGDSISSGDFGESARWPDLAGGRLGAVVLNLARPSETVSSSLGSQMPLVGRLNSDDLVVIELGGNDMLDGRPVEDYSRDLARLLRESTSTGASVVLLEIPILPGKWAYGFHQRRLARAYDVTLVPRRTLLRVLADQRLVSDGLHLRQAGHEKLALSLEPWLRLPPE